MSHGCAGARLRAAEMMVGVQHPSLKEALRAGTPPGEGLEGSH